MPALEEYQSTAWNELESWIGSSRRWACLKVSGTSMLPFLRSGDRVAIGPLEPGRVLKLGDLVVFRFGNQVLLHRFLVQRGGRLLMKGDNCLACDPPVEPGAILGVAVALELDGKWEPLSHPHWVFFNRLAGAAGRVQVGLPGPLRRIAKAVTAVVEAWMLSLCLSHSSQ